MFSEGSQPVMILCQILLVKKHIKTTQLTLCIKQVIIHDIQLVVSSAGVGRTGTFIALCNLLQEAEVTGKMDFLSTLWKLRQDRMHTIQTVVRSTFNVLCVEASYAWIDL